MRDCPEGFSNPGLTISLGQNNEVGSAILGPSLFVMAGIERFVLAVTDRGDSIRGKAKGDEKLLRALSPPFAQGKIVFRSSPFVAVALDLDLGVWISL
jgi:hypothetical protein